MSSQKGEYSYSTHCIHEEGCLLRLAYVHVELCARRHLGRHPHRLQRRENFALGSHSFALRTKLAALISARERSLAYIQRNLQPPPCLITLVVGQKKAKSPPPPNISSRLELIPGA